MHPLDDHYGLGCLGAAAGAVAIHNAATCFHNEALTRLDAALHLAVEAAGIRTPPVDPVDGQCWVVGAAAVGVWSGRDHDVASWCESGWRFIAPQPGMLVWNKASALWIYWTGIGWSSGELPTAEIRVNGLKVVGERQPHPPSPSGGTVIDQEARASIEAITAALMSHGLID